MKSFNRYVLLVSALAAIISCGGGGGGSDNGGGNGGGGGTTNTAPVANAGNDQTVGADAVVSLSGAGSSDANGDALTYSWSLDTMPPGSAATLTSTSAVSTGFTVDELGEYVVSLVVNDGTVDSAADQVTITATDGSADSLGLTDIELRDSSPLVADFYTPAPISHRLTLERAVTWTAYAGLPENLSRFSFGDAATDDVVSITDTDTTVGDALTVSVDLATDTQVDNDLLLRSTFQFVEIDTNSYAIFSAKHSNYALGEDGSNNIVLRDVRSTAAHSGGTASLLTFAIGTSPLTLVANGKYTIDGSVNDSIAYTADAWTNQEVVVNGGSLELAATGGTAMKLYEPPIQLDIPIDFNPDDIARVSNPEFYDANRAAPDAFDSGIANLNSVYAPQTAVQGSDADTLAAVNTMLDWIDTTLASQGSQTRYPREFYLALREGMFERVIQASESFDGEMGDLTTPYIYFTNQTDGNGDYHPFMVIASRNIPDGFSHLRDVTRPPGDGRGGNFNDQNVTRGFFRKNYLLKIPLRDYGEVATPGENTNVPVFNNASGDDHHAYASTGQVGVAVDGVLVFPAFNNQGRFSQELGEISAIGLHAGTGLDAHYHADPHSASLTNDNRDTGLSFYNEEDYAGRNHPPITSIGLDGVAGYGFYLDGDTASDGATIPLDDFGAHEHHDYGYHYHTLRDGQTVNGMPYETHEMGPLGAWAGRANFMPAIEVGERGQPSQWLGNDGTSVTPPPASFTVTSSVMQNGAALPDNLKCDRDGGTGDSPPIEWTNLPAGTESIAVIMEHYPQGTVQGVDVPSQYWLLWGIPGDTTSIPQGNPASLGNEGSDKDGVTTGYTAPCSPGGGGTNDYTINVFALDTADIGLGSADDINVDWQALTGAIDGNVLASGSIDFIN